MKKEENVALRLMGVKPECFVCTHWRSRWETRAGVCGKDHEGFFKFHDESCEHFILRETAKK